MRKCSSVLEKEWMVELSNLCHCVQDPWKLTSRDYWSSRNERKPLSQQKCVLGKCCKYLKMVNGRALKPLPLGSAHLKTHWSGFWSSRNKRKPLSKLKYVLRKCLGVSQKEWMLELSNLCHCVQHPWKLTSRDYWSSRNERKSLSKLKHVWENAVECLRKSDW